ncbi:MAG: sugar ABC transporter ATP-binding protein [Planctomycetota bacterium]|jgi:inositol transport system ATP-binding protein|nr:sugar ABC transporter ATP-binding protein [Planctomycetota bacterium]
MDPGVKLRLAGISKNFPGVRALDGVDVTLRSGTVHAIMGENGAGKSTLMKIINGLYRQDRGEIYLDGKKIEVSSPLKASELGIAMIYQELNYFPDLSIEENLFMRRYPTKGGFINWKGLRERTRAIFAENGVHYDPAVKIKELSVSNIQMLEILKAVAFKARIIIMDEPTSSISAKEVDHLFAVINRLRDSGVSILYISHKMDEIFRIADDITVLRDGRTITAGPADSFTEDSLITAMVGRPIENIYPKECLPLGEIFFEVRDFNSKGVFADINLQVRRGEIVGLAGLVGAGRTELACAVFGMDPYDSGEIRLDGKPLKIRSIGEAIRNGILMVSEDRKKFGVLPMRSIRENIAIASLRINRGKLVNLKRERLVSQRLFSSLNVKAPGLDAELGTLSGGNQQKVILARWLMVDSKVMIMDEPTRGIDVGSKFEIYSIMTRLVREKGVSIVMISSEMPELIGMSDRIYVMNKGRITGELRRDEFSQERIMVHATNAG